MVVGVSSVVGPKRYERWGVPSTTPQAKRTGEMASKRKLQFRNYQPTSGELKSKAATVLLPAPILDEAREAQKSVRYGEDNAVAALDRPPPKKKKKKVSGGAGGDGGDECIARMLEAHANEETGDDRAGRSGDLLNIAPRKPNWDLKRDLGAKMERLNKRTKYAIVQLIKHRIDIEANASGCNGDE